MTRRPWPLHLLARAGAALAYVLRCVAWLLVEAADRCDGSRRWWSR